MFLPLSLTWDGLKHFWQSSWLHAVKKIYGAARRKQTTARKQLCRLAPHCKCSLTRVQFHLSAPHNIHWTPPITMVKSRTMEKFVYETLNVPRAHWVDKNKQNGPLYSIVSMSLKRLCRHNFFRTWIWQMRRTDAGACIQTISFRARFRKVKRNRRLVGPFDTDTERWSMG